MVGHWYGLRGGVGVASLGISWMQRYSLLPGTSSSSHTRSSRFAVGRNSLSSSVCFLHWRGCFVTVRCQQTPSQNIRLVGHLRVKGKIGCWAVVKSAQLKEASVVNNEYTHIGLVIRGGSP